MFTRRTLFKLLAAIGVGSLWPTQGAGERFSLDHLLPSLVAYIVCDFLESSPREWWLVFSSLRG